MWFTLPEHLNHSIQCSKAVSFYVEISFKDDSFQFLSIISGFWVVKRVTQVLWLQLHRLRRKIVTEIRILRSVKLRTIMGVLIKSNMHLALIIMYKCNFHIFLHNDKYLQFKYIWRFNFYVHGIHIQYSL